MILALLIKMFKLNVLSSNHKGLFGLNCKMRQVLFGLSILISASLAPYVISANSCSILTLWNCSNIEICQRAEDTIDVRPNKFLEEIISRNLGCADLTINGASVDYYISDKFNPIVENQQESFGFRSPFIRYLDKFKGFTGDWEQVYIAAKNGDAIAQYIYGLGLQTGEISKIDLNAAFEWYERSAKAGYPPAIYNVSKFYRFGTGTRADLIESHRLLMKLRKYKLPEALYDLGVSFRDGIGTDQSLERARYYFEEASKQKFYPAAYGLGHLHAAGTFADSNGKARRYFKKAATGDLPLAKLWYLIFQIDYLSSGRDVIRSSIRVSELVSTISMLQELQNLHFDSKDQFGKRVQSYSFKLFSSDEFLLSDEELAAIPDLKQKLVTLVLNDSEARAYKNMKAMIQLQTHEVHNLHPGTKNSEWDGFFFYFLCVEESDLLSSKYCKQLRLVEK